MADLIGTIEEDEEVEVENESSDSDSEVKHLVQTLAQILWINTWYHSVLLSKSQLKLNFYLKVIRQLASSYSSSIGNASYQNITQ